jgi:hypothetical protein
MSDQRPIQSILAVDVGSTLTHACLIDIVEGTFRLLARAECPSTVLAPEDDVMLGVTRALQQLEQVAQRPLLTQQKHPVDPTDPASVAEVGPLTLISPELETGEGVDLFVATSSAAPALRCAIVGLTNALSVESAQAACDSTNALVTESVSLSKRMRWDSQVLARLRASPPDVIVMVGGVDNGPTDPQESAARVLAATYSDLERARRPIVVFAGNLEARKPIANVLSREFDLRFVDNVRPDVYTESLGELQRELASIYEQVKLTALPGHDRLRAWCRAPIMSTTEATGAVLRYIARRNELSQGVLGVDVGGSTTQIGAACGSTYQWSVGAWLGTSYGISRVLDNSGIGHIQRWIPLSTSHEDTLQRLENARLRPQSIPQTMEELLTTHAVLRQALLLVMRAMRQRYWADADPAASELETTPPFDLIAARGGVLAHTAQEGLVAVSLLDALQPVGLTRLVIDWASIWPQLGAIATLLPLAASQVLERDAFRELGTIIAPIGEARDGEPALNLRIIRPGSAQGEEQVTELDVPAGVIQRLPLGLHEHAIVEVRPSHLFDIGLGRKGLGGKAQVRGGSLGLVVDTRGRPLALPQDAQQRITKLQHWLENLISDVNGAA